LLRISYCALEILRRVDYGSFMGFPTAIHQLLAGFSNGDAISNEARLLRTIFRSWGCASEIFCEHTRTLPELRHDTPDLSEAVARIAADDVVVLHLSIGSAANEMFRTLPGRKVILYHNVTPEHYFRAVNEATANALASGREQAATLAGSAVVNLADSGYNAEEMRAWGYENPLVFPLVLDLDSFDGPVHKGLLARYQDGLTNVLFVGRCAPNKRLEDVLHAFYYFQRHIQPNSRLIHVGSFAGTEPYLAMLGTIKKNLGLENVDFLGSIPDDQLRACYRAAHVFLCMSEHEGFCIPLLEAMTRQVPVLAHASSAIPETMGGAGVCFDTKNFDEVAEMMGLLSTPGAIRDAIIHQQNARISRYRSRHVETELRTLLAPVLS